MSLEQPHITVLSICYLQYFVLDIGPDATFNNGHGVDIAKPQQPFGK